MNHIFFLTGSASPKTGGEYYNFKLFERLKTENLDPVYIDLHTKRYLYKLSWLPLIGDVFINLIMAILLNRRCSGLVIEDHYFVRYLVLFNFIHKTFRKDSKIVTILHHFDHYDSQKDRQKSRYFQRALAQIREQLHFYWTDIIVTNSEFNRKEVRSLGIDKKEILVLPPALERENLQDATELEESKVGISILCVGHCIPRKGIIYLIEAFSQLERQGIKLHIVGNLNKHKKYRQKAVSLIDQLDLQNDVILHSRLSQTELNQLYSSADIFVLPSLKEGFGIVLLEAMYFSLPVVTTNISAMPELVKDGENGLLVSPGSSQHLAQALSRLVSDLELRENMGKKGKEQVIKSYYWEQTSSRFLQIVQRLNVSKISKVPVSAS